MVVLAVAGFILAGTGTGCMVGNGKPQAPDSGAVADSLWYADSAAAWSSDGERTPPFWDADTSAVLLIGMPGVPGDKRRKNLTKLRWTDSLFDAP